MEKFKTYNYDEYDHNIKKLFKELFGIGAYENLNNIPFKPIEWDGIDLTCTEIISTTPGIKERFTKRWEEYFSERDYTMFDLFIHSVYHYGYQQKYHQVENDMWSYRKDIRDDEKNSVNALLKIIEGQQEEIKLLKEKYENKTM